MALSLHTNQLSSSLTIPLPKLHRPKPTPPNVHIRCGPRDNRGPLVKGRVLSIEAIQAVQALKRAHRTDPDTAPTLAHKTLSRLLKSDLLACLRELLRQDQCALALQVFSTVRSEYHPDLSLYADVVKALGRNNMGEDIDRLIADLEMDGGDGGVQWGDARGVLNLVRAVIGADRRESTVRIYGMLKRGLVGSTGSGGVDDHLVGVLSRGLRRLGEPGLANEVIAQFGGSYEGSSDKITVYIK